MFISILLSFRPTEKPILQNFYFTNPPSHGEKDTRGSASKSSSHLFGSLWGSDSSQPYASVARVNDNMKVSSKIYPKKNQTGYITIVYFP